MSGTIRAPGLLARLLCMAAFAVQMLVPTLHVVHAGVPVACADAAFATGADGWHDAASRAAPHDGGTCTLCAVLAAAHHGVGSAAATPDTPPCAGPAPAAPSAHSARAAAHAEAAPRAPPCRLA